MPTDWSLVYVLRSSSSAKHATSGSQTKRQKGLVMDSDRHQSEGCGPKCGTQSEKRRHKAEHLSDAIARHCRPTAMNKGSLLCGVKRSSWPRCSKQEAEEEQLCRPLEMQTCRHPTPGKPTRPTKRVLHKAKREARLQRKVCCATEQLKHLSESAQEKAWERSAILGISKTGRFASR